MKKNIPFKKQLTFKTNVNEITSIALEHTLNHKDHTVEGELIISGTYKITETSTIVDNFEFKIPINIEIDSKYITDNIIIDINDFYYELINNNILEVNIEISIDNITEKPMIEQVREEIPEEPQKIEIKKEIIEQTERKDERCIEEEYEEETNDKKEIKEIFDNFTEDEEMSTYHVYIVRESDTIESIITKYDITKEQLSEYNDINELKIGDKIIIPDIKNARD